MDQLVSMDTRVCRQVKCCGEKISLEKMKRCESVRLNLHMTRLSLLHINRVDGEYRENLIQLVDFENRAMRLRNACRTRLGKRTFYVVSYGLDSQGRSVGRKD